MTISLDYHSRLKYLNLMVAAEAFGPVEVVALFGSSQFALRSLTDRRVRLGDMEDDGSIVFGPTKIAAPIANIK